MRRFRALFLILGLGIFSSAAAVCWPAAPLSPTQLSRAVLHTLVRVECLGAGTGVLLDDGRVLTAFHVIRDHATTPIKVFLFDWDENDVVSNSPYDAALLAHDEARDLALLSGPPTPRPGAKLLPRAIRVGRFTPVISSGCPLGNEPVHFRGEIIDIAFDIDGYPYIISSSPTAPGCSGGGLFYVDGDRVYLVGILCRIGVAGFSLLPNLNYAAPPSALRVFVGV